MKRIYLVYTTDVEIMLMTNLSFILVSGDVAKLGLRVKGFYGMLHKIFWLDHPDCETLGWSVLYAARAPTLLILLFYKMASMLRIGVGDGGAVFV